MEPKSGGELEVFKFKSPWCKSAKRLEKEICYDLKSPPRCQIRYDLAANGAGTLTFIDYFTAEGSSRMNAEVCRSLSCAQIWPNASKLMWHCVLSLSQTTVQKQTSETTKELFKVRRQTEILPFTDSHDPSEGALLMKTRRPVSNPYVCFSWGGRLCGSLICRWKFTKDWSCIL